MDWWRCRRADSQPSCAPGGGSCPSRIKCNWPCMTQLQHKSPAGLAGVHPGPSQLQRKSTPPWQGLLPQPLTCRVGVHLAPLPRCPQTTLLLCLFEGKDFAQGLRPPAGLVGVHLALLPPLLLVDAHVGGAALQHVEGGGVRVALQGFTRDTGASTRRVTRTSAEPRPGAYKVEASVSPCVLRW